MCEKQCVCYYPHFLSFGCSWSSLTQGRGEARTASLTLKLTLIKFQFYLPVNPAYWTPTCWVILGHIPPINLERVFLQDWPWLAVKWKLKYLYSTECICKFHKLRSETVLTIWIKEFYDFNMRWGAWGQTESRNDMQQDPQPGTITVQGLNCNL